MALPTAVQRNADKARAALSGLNGVKAPTDSPQAMPGEYLDPTTPSPSVESNVTTAQGQESFRHHALSADASPAQAPSTDPASAGVVKGFVDPDDWKGRYAALRSARDERTRQLEQQVQQLQAVNGQLKQQLADAQPAPVEAKRFEIDEQTRERLGDDQAQVLDQLNQSVDQRFAKVEQERKDEVQRQAKRFESNLTSLVPQWQVINQQQEWLAWLNEIDPTSGVVRQRTLNVLVDEGDAQSVANMFRTFVSGEARSEQQSGQRLSPEVTTGRVQADAGGSDMVEMWSQGEIAAFYQEKSRLYRSGKLVGDVKARADAEEAKIRKAITEGRVEP